MQSFALIVAVVLLLGSCSRDHSPLPILETSVDRNGNTSTVHLSVSLNEIATGRIAAPKLTPAWEFSGVDLEVANVSDARFIGRGLAVLDRQSREVLILGLDSNTVQRVGRPGQGPGEFADPWAMVAVGRNLVVTQPIDPVFIAFDSAGNYIRSASAPVDGDWRNPIFRAPSLGLDDFLTVHSAGTARSRSLAARAPCLPVLSHSERQGRGRAASPRCPARPHP